MKKEKKGFTYARFSEKAGIQSPNYLKLVSDGKKNLTSSNIIKFASAIGLNAEELDYFEALVSFNQAKAPQEKEYHLKKLTKLKLSSQDFGNQKNLIQLKGWKPYAVAMLTNLPYFVESPQWISKKLNGLVTPEEAEKILKELIDLNFLSLNTNGKPESILKNIISSDKSTLNELWALATHPAISDSSNEIIMDTQYINISATQIPEFRKRINECLFELGQMAKENPRPEQLYTITITGLPLSTKEEFREDSILYN